MTKLEWDTSQVDRLSLDLSEAPGRMQRKAPRVFAGGALEITNRLKVAAEGHRYLPGLANRVNYDKLGDLHYEIGFEKVGQGNLANFAVYGSINNAPIMMSPADAARLEMPAIERNLADAGEAAVLEGDE